MGNCKVITLRLCEQFYLFCEDESTAFQICSADMNG